MKISPDLTRGFPYLGAPQPVPLLTHPHVVITGSVNSSELTVFDPVIHVWRSTAHVDGRVLAQP